MVAWDRSHDWVLQRFWRDLTRVAIQFRRVPPTVTELAAVRRCLPQFRDIAPAAAQAAIGDDGVLPVGELPSCEVRQLIEAAQGQGLDVVTMSASSVRYLPYDRTTGCAWLIEDDADAAAVAQSMLAEGVPVHEVEA